MVGQLLATTILVEGSGAREERVGGRKVRGRETDGGKTDGETETDRWTDRE